MAATAGHKSLVKVTDPDTAAASFASAAPMTDIGDTPLTQYQITDSTKRVLSRTAAITFQASTDSTDWTDGTWGDVANSGGSAYTLDRLRGIVTFDSAQAAGTKLRVKSGTGEYLTLVTAGEARSFSYSLSVPSINTTYFGNTYVSRIQGIKDVSGNVGMFYVDELFYDLLDNGNVVVLEFYSDSTADPDLVVWALISDRDVNISVDGAVEETMNFVSASGDDDDNVVSLL